MSKTMKYISKDATTILVKRWELLDSQKSIFLKMNKSKFILAVLLGITTLFTSLFGQNIDSLNIDSIFVKSYIDNNHEKYSFHY